MKRSEVRSTSSKMALVEISNVSIALGLISIYFYVIDLFQPEYFILYRGVTWDKAYRLSLVDAGVYGLIPLVAIFPAICIYAVKGLKSASPVKVALYLLSALIVINLIPLSYWMSYLYNPPLSINQIHGMISELDAELFYICAPMYPLLLILTMYSWMLPFLLKKFRGHIRLRIGSRETSETADDEPQSTSAFRRKLGLISIALLSAILPTIPYLPSINPEFRPVSVDIPSYSRPLNYMLSTDCWRAVDYAFHGGYRDRPLYLLMLYGLVILGVPRDFVLNLEAVLIAPLFALMVYFTAGKLSNNHLYALLASLAGILGFDMTANMMGGFFTAWMALSLFYACVALTPSLEEGDAKSLAGCISASVLTLYIHPWTWSLLMAVLTAYLATSTLKSFKRGAVKFNKYIFIVLISNAMADLLKNAITFGRGGLVTSAYTVSRGFNFNNLLHLLWNLHRITTTYLSGLLFNPLHMLLALVGILNLFKRRDKRSQLTITWVAVASAPFLLGSTALQSRLLLAMPFPLLIAEGLWRISNFLGRFDSKLPRLFQAFFIVSSLTYTVRALCNLI
ncbi:MAG: hypothetical protein QXR45_10800 [Candidatus Bathyarchaeia archaeon]